MKNQPKFYKSSILLIITLLAGCGENSETVSQMNVGDLNNTVVSSNQSNNLSTEEFTRLQTRAANVKIIRDDYGVPHIYGKTDADTVFGLLFAQAEDDFSRIERNYIWAIGRLAEVEGEAALFSDLRARLYMTTDEAKDAYEASPDWLKALCDAYADGLNFYWATHPEVKPKLLTRFEPWMPMFFSEGSIGGDIE